MKKIFYIALSALAALFVSCDMEKFPHTGIEESQYGSTYEDVVNLSVSIYTPTKSLFGGGRLDLEEIRGGMFNAKADFGNYYGLFYAWIMETNDQDAEGPWFSDYAIIASQNYMIGVCEKFLENNDLDEDDEEDAAKLAKVRNYVAEAHMTRAMAYWDLVTKYCAAYDPATASSTYGLPIQLEYAPTSDASKYPGRSSLEETYAQILVDLEAAANMTTEGVKNSKYWTIDAVNAMRARVYLNMKNYEEAATIAQGLINSGTYTLANSQSAMDNMWYHDASDENIFMTAASLQDPCTSTGSYYIYDNVNRDGSTPNPQYLPSQTLLDLYGATADEKAKDYRFNTYFQPREITVEGVATKEMYLMWKYVGNPDLRSGAQLNYVSAGKPFRIAEQYLIAAEACAQSGNISIGAKLLNDLRRARIADYTDGSYLDAASLLAAVQDEWSRECVGEGFRMINMKRWGKTIIRGESQDPTMTRPGTNYDDLVKEVSGPEADPRSLWPIPKSEIDSNPQIRDQQNPGY
ncbi:MAG: RagB/SusD family nutrient uptake outer membrane protein [Tidjanibacter sp.]|nr:RagB/SusD family nutrient uptake outer membrane protein [Tidjanibacter sp.]